MPSRTPSSSTRRRFIRRPRPERGIARWSDDAFAAALRTGVGPDRMPRWPPMPIFRFLDADEVGALRAYLASVPAVERKNYGRPRKPPAADDPPEKVFA